MPTDPNTKRHLEERLIALAQRLIDQERAHILVCPHSAESGYWFGGGNVVRDQGGTYHLVGRYRNRGDSRTGLAAGTRGLELALFSSHAFAGPYEKRLSFSKADLSAAGREVLSIEGSCLLPTTAGVALYVSSEKARAYPEAFRAHQKPGTGVWSIDLLTAPDLDHFDPGSLQEALSSQVPAGLHVKDPAVFEHSQGTVMIYCTHPFAWSSTNSALAMRPKGEAGFRTISESLLARGPVWDVAATRITDRLPLPQVGVLAELPPLSLYFYDGAECLRPHEQHAAGVHRPRGYSCEEIGGLAWGFDEAFPRLERLSVNAPLFVSPYGTGCSRYVSTLVTDEAICASWQQSQPDGSQPLVGHQLLLEEVERILGADYR